jgi:preprotein translocase subunit YajC
MSATSAASAIPAVLHLQAQPPSADFSFFLMIGTIGLIFYFLVFRPQNQKQKELEVAIKGAQTGDTVVTTGGLHGRVRTAGETVLTIEIANVKGSAVRVEVERSRIERVVKGGVLKEASADDANKGKKSAK